MRLFLFIALVFTLTACADRVSAPVQPTALSAPLTKQIFVATNRSRNDAGYLDSGRNPQLSFLDTTVSIPVSRTPGEPPQFRARPNPEKHFVIANEKNLGSLGNMTTSVSKALSELPPENRELTVFVHGFYNTYQDSLFRVAQLKQDFDVPGVTVSFAWASAGRPLGYAYDRESALFSRDDLERTLRALAQARAKRLLIVGHSLGTLLITETLRQIDLKTPGWSKRNIDGLMLISPDMPVDLFVRNVEPLKSLPQPTVILTSSTDNALRLSSRINRSQQRLGQLSEPDALADLSLFVIDVSTFSDASGSNHMTFAESPALIAMLRDAREVDALLEPEDVNFLTRSADRVRVSDQATAIKIGNTGDGS